MTEVEFLAVVGTLSGSYLIGYSIGFTILTVRKFTEKI